MNSRSDGFAGKTTRSQKHGWGASSTASHRSHDANWAMSTRLLGKPQQTAKHETRGNSKTIYLWNGATASYSHSSQALAVRLTRSLSFAEFTVDTPNSIQTSIQSSGYAPTSISIGLRNSGASNSPCSASSAGPQKQICRSRQGRQTTRSK